MGSPRRLVQLLPAPWQTSLLFDRIKSFLAVRLIYHKGKKWLKSFSVISSDQGTHFAEQVVWILAKTSWASWRLSPSLTSFVVRQGPQSKGIGYMRLNRLISKTKISMTFCLTCYWLLIFVFRYKKVLLKSLMV